MRFERSHASTDKLSRSLFLTLLTALLATGCSATMTSASHTEALLLSCMDYRLVDDTERFMSQRGLRDKYDHVILAGASLGATTDKYPSWNQTFWDHLQLAVSLHKIKKMMLLDHRDCGAYKVILGVDLAKDRAGETEAHGERLRALEKLIHERFPDLEVELLLMSLDGNVETIPPSRKRMCALCRPYRGSKQDVHRTRTPRLTPWANEMSPLRGLSCAPRNPSSRRDPAPEALARVAGGEREAPLSEQAAQKVIAPKRGRKRVKTILGLVQPRGVQVLPRARRVTFSGQTREAR